MRGLRGDRNLEAEMNRGRGGIAMGLRGAGGTGVQWREASGLVEG